MHILTPGGSADQCSLKRVCHNSAPVTHRVIYNNDNSSILDGQQIHYYGGNISEYIQKNTTNLQTLLVNCGDCRSPMSVCLSRKLYRRNISMRMREKIFLGGAGGGVRQNFVQSLFLRNLQRLTYIIYIVYCQSQMVQA